MDQLSDEAFDAGFGIVGEASGHVRRVAGQGESVDEVLTYELCAGGDALIEDLAPHGLDRLGVSA